MIERAETIAHQLAKPGQELAFLEAGEQIYFARHSIGPRQPFSAIVRLIQGIYEHDPRMARKIVRNRIYATAEPTGMCRAMIKVAAKRLTAPIMPRPHAAIPLPSIFLDVSEPVPAAKIAMPVRPPGADPMSLALELAARIPREEAHLYACDRPVGAVLTSPEGETLAWAVNSNARNRTLHAELLLIQMFYLRTGKLIPPGATLHVTLKPCKMCAAMIVHSAEEIPTTKVIYKEDDPGPNARNTALDQANVQFRA